MCYLTIDQATKAGRVLSQSCEEQVKYRDPQLETGGPGGGVHVVAPALTLTCPTRVADPVTEGLSWLFLEPFGTMHQEQACLGCS